MSMKIAKSIPDYFKDTSPAQKAEFDRIRQIVKGVAPDAEETISYGMPTFKYKGRPLLHFGVFKDHMSLFPTAEPIGELKDKLAEFTIAKGTIKFTEDHVVPEELVKDLLSIRIAAIVEKA